MILDGLYATFYVTSRNVSMHAPLRIAVLADRSSIGALLARGLGAYAQTHGLPWTLIHIDPKQIGADTYAIQNRLDTDYDGIAGFLDADGLSWALTKQCPIISYSRKTIRTGRWVRICGDDAAIGVMAARHLVEQGYRSFACTGLWSREVVAKRYDTFIAELARLGHGCAVDDHARKQVGKTREPDAETNHLNWLASLPQPVAIFHHQDRAALYASECCTSAGLRVPEQVAILGVDDSIICEAGRPPLSSIALPWHHMGNLGGLHLHRMLNGDVGGVTIHVPPLRVVQRESTARPRIEDQVVARCLEQLERTFMKERQAPELAASLGVSLSTLHRRLRAATGTSLREHLHRIRIARARELLATTDLPIAEVATRSGYASRQRFGAMFRKQTGFAPRDMRHPPM